MVEFDVRLTADRELLVFHASHVDGVPVSELALADIQAVYASENQRLPLLGELVEIAQGRATLNVEVKEPGYEVEVLKALQVVEPTRPPMITSFRDRALTTIRRLAPSQLTGLLVGGDESILKGGVRTRDIFPFRRMNACGANVLLPHISLKRTGLYGRALRRRVPVYAWTVNGERAISMLIADPAVGGIITDFPELAITLREKAFRRSSTPGSGG
jgi:glycerophosphoryl diester phosphodiesterase